MNDSDADSRPGFDLERRRMARALMNMLSDRSISEETKTKEVDATLSVIRQLASLAGISHG